MGEDAYRDDADALRRLLAIVARLRGENGCPWDREQTLESLKPFLIEEAYELLETIDSGDAEAHREELGDVLLQVLLQARIREEEGAFRFADVAETLSEKLVRRHPHVFGDEDAATSREVLKKWEAIKSRERGGRRESVLDGIPAALPALQLAQRVQVRASRVGFDWPDADGIAAKLDEELAEMREAVAGGDAARIEAELGDLLFTLVNLSRFLGVNAEDALRKTVARFGCRFREVERRVSAEGHAIGEATPDEMNAHWDAVKREGESPTRA